MQNLLRPNQVADLDQEERQLENKLKEPTVDRGAVNGQLKRLKRMRDTQSPRDLQGQEKDSIVKEQKQLLDKILEGMPSREEMRKSPPGAVDKHMKWEKRNKEAIVRWKNNELRLNAGSDDTEIANLERFRPEKSSLNMDNAFIPGKQYHMPAGPITVFNGMEETERQEYLISLAVKYHDKDLAAKLGVRLPKQQGIGFNLDKEPDGEPLQVVKRRTGRPPKSKVEDE